jgi:hypothetical protein
LRLLFAYEVSCQNRSQAGSQTSVGENGDPGLASFVVQGLLGHDDLRVSTHVNEVTSSLDGGPGQGLVENIGDGTHRNVVLGEEPAGGLDVRDVDDVSANTASPSSPCDGIHAAGISVREPELRNGALSREVPEACGALVPGPNDEDLHRIISLMFPVLDSCSSDGLD